MAWRDRGVGHDYLHVAIDDASRVAYVADHPNERATTTVRFLGDVLTHFASLGVSVERVMTDNAMTYTRSPRFATLLDERTIRHLRTGPRRPQTTGKVASHGAVRPAGCYPERYVDRALHRHVPARLGVPRLYRTNGKRLESLPSWVDSYNRRRSHAGLEGRTPMAVLVDEVGGNDN
jgi:hypothetical protein